MEEKSYVEKFYQKVNKEERLADRGRYPLALSREGYLVDAVELAEHNIQIFKSKLKAKDNISIFQGDATGTDG